MNIGNITSDNFNLDGNGKDIQIEVYEQLIEQLQQENKILKENAENNDKVVDKVNWENQLLKKENKKQKEVIDKSREYLTSYSSIHTIQFGTEKDSLNDIELNKTLDEKTLNEMTYRYLKVHDKLLDILEEVE